MILVRETRRWKRQLRTRKCSADRRRTRAMETIRSPAPTGFFSHPWRRPPAPLNGGLKNIRNLTAEVAEHAEGEMAKCLAPGCSGKSGPFPHPSRKVKTAKGHSRNDLCALCLLIRSSSCLHPRRIERQRGVHIDKMIRVFCLYQDKALRSLRTLRLIFSSSSEGAEAFIIS